MKPNNIYTAFLILLLSLFTTSVFAQNAENQKYKLAESYENSGDMKNAARLYKELFDLAPKSDVYFRSLVRTYKHLNRYTELLEIIKHRMDFVKSTEQESLYGEILWRLGQNQEANKVLENLIGSNKKSEKVYNEVSNTLISLKLYDKAIAVLEGGRDALGNKEIFSDYLCQLYIITGNYKKGTDEVLSGLAHNRNIPMAQGRISALMTSKEATEKIKEMIEDRMDMNNPFDLRLWGWFNRTINNYDKAFEIYKKIDQQIKADGREIYLFASESQKDGQYDIAMKAYDYLIELGKKSQYFSAGLYGYPRTLEQKLASSATLSEDNAKAIIKRYRSIIEMFPNQSIAADCMYRIAVISRDYLNNDNDAIIEFGKIINSFTRSKIASDAMMEMADIYLKRDSLDLCSKYYRDVAQNFRNSFPESANKALYRLAEIEYYSGNIDTAMTMFDELSQETNSDVSVESLNKIVLIDQNKNLTLALKTFAKAELRKFQNKKSEAIELFKETVKTADGTDLAERSIVKLIEIYSDQGDYKSAKEIIEKQLQKSPNSIFSDLIMMNLANIYMKENNTEAAIKTYTDLITLYPRSIYLQEARDKIKKLRSKNKT